MLVRERRWLRDTFHVLPEYLQDTEAEADELNFCEYGIQLTRRFRALKLWMSLKYFGRDAFEEALNRGIELAASFTRSGRSFNNRAQSWRPFSAPMVRAC